MAVNKKPKQVLNANVPELEDQITIELAEVSDRLESSLSEQNDSLIGGISSLMGGITDVIVNGKSTVVGDRAYLEVPTRDYIDEKIADVNLQMSIIRNDLSIVSNKVTELSTITSKHSDDISVLQNSVEAIQDSMLHKNLSILPDAKPNELSIESQDNLLVYLYNSTDKLASKAKLTELGYWDCESK